VDSAGREIVSLVAALPAQQLSATICMDSCKRPIPVSSCTRGIVGSGKIMSASMAIPVLGNVRAVCC
jgi:hypothetical protein